MKHLGGIYLGTVHDNADPDSRLRLRLKVPMVLGDETTGWALPCLPANWRTGLVKPHSTHTGHSNHNFTDTNDGMGSSGPGSFSLAHDHNHDAHDNNHTLISKVPDVGTQIWVMFMGGDPDYPVWLGTL